MNELARKKKKGFTLIELIAVIAIIGILAAVLVPKVLGYMNDAKRSKIQGQCRTFVMAVETYNSKENSVISSLGQVALAGGTEETPVTPESSSTSFSTFKELFDDEDMKEKYKDYFDLSNLDMIGDDVTYAQAKVAANGRDAEGNVRTIDVKDGLEDGKWDGSFVEDSE